MMLRLFRSPPLPAALHLPGPPPVEVALRRSARARRILLRVGRPGSAPVLTLPQRASVAEAAAFLREQEDWLRQALGRRPALHRVEPGALMPVEGRGLRLLPAPGRGIRVLEDALLVPGAEAGFGPRVAAHLRALARDRLAAACDRHSAALGRPYTALALRDTRSRWGSCTVDGRLMFSWRLVMAPPAVLDYVAAHEVAHLARMDHSPAFWAVVARLCPDHRALRAWLRGSEGAALHRWDFGPRG